MNVLIAEDDHVSRQVLVAQLRKLGYDPMVAADGREAWKLFETSAPSLVITDWRMPGWDGLELCRRIRAAARPGYTYVIMLTAASRDVGFLVGMEAGADDYVTKPCGSLELDARLRVAERILALQTRVRWLERLLPICPRCKRICDDDGTWQQVEEYFMRRAGTRFSHGICPECYERHVKPGVMRLKRAK